MRRIAFILSFVANIGLALVSLAVSPSRVAIHFGADGNADNWAPNYVPLIIFLLVPGLLFFTIYYSPLFVTLALYMVYAVVWCVSLYRGFRLHNLRIIFDPTATNPGKRYPVSGGTYNAES